MWGVGDGPPVHPAQAVGNGRFGPTARAVGPAEVCNRCMLLRLYRVRFRHMLKKIVSIWHGKKILD